MMSILRQFAPRQEIYSIDEAFLDLSGQPGNLTDYGQAIRQRVSQWIGIPTCVGIGPTKTLAKLANHIAKKRPEWAGVCDLTAAAPSAVEALMASIAVAEVWGVGRRLAERLQAQGITTVLDLQRLDPGLARRRHSVNLERSVCANCGACPACPWNRSPRPDRTSSAAAPSADPSRHWTICARPS